VISEPLLETSSVTSKLRRGAAMLDGSRLAIPLTVGVVGHRDCLDREKLEGSIRTLLGELRDSYADTSLQILSSLADGADRIAAKVALEMEFDVIAPLPMPREMYEQDFDEESRREFGELLSRMREWFDLPLLASREDVVKQGPARNRQYEQAGAFIVGHSQIFLALWDGTLSNAVGGTAASVHFRRHGVPRSYTSSQSPLDVPDTGPVYHIVTRRKTNSGGSSPSMEEAGTVRILLPESASRASDSEEHDLSYYAQLCASIDAFNRAGARLLADNSAMVPQSAGYLLGVATTGRDRSDPDPPMPPASSGVHRIVAAYAATDSVAVLYQRRSTKMTRLFFGLGGLMVLSFAIYSCWPTSTPALLVYWSLFASMAVTFYLARVGENYDFFLDARALAEALRVQFYWRMAGSWEGVAHHYLRKQAEELRWIREALRSLDIAPPYRVRLTDHLAWARGWILDQSHYLEGSVAARAHRLSRVTKHSYELYTAGLIVGLIVSLLVVVAWFRGSKLPDQPLAIGVMMMGLAPALAALSSGYAEFMSFEEDVSRYARMKTIFERAKLAVEAFTEELKKTAAVSENQPSGSRDEATEAHRLHDLLHDLGSEALRENADWLLLHRSHRPKAQVT